jgi:zinc protease
MGLGGGGAMGRSARLYRALVAAGLARSAGSDLGLSLDPYLLVVGVTALPGVEPSRIEDVVEREFARMRDETVPEAELGRAMKQVQAQYVYSAEGVTNQAFWIGQMEIVDNYGRADTLIDELAAVTAADIQRVSATYLTPDQRTVGWLVPEGPGGGGADGAVLPAALPDLNYRRCWYTGAPPQGSVENDARAASVRASRAAERDRRPRPSATGRPGRRCPLPARDRRPSATRRARKVWPSSRLGCSPAARPG